TATGVIVIMATTTVPTIAVPTTMGATPARTTTTATTVRTATMAGTTAMVAITARTADAGWAKPLKLDTRMASAMDRVTAQPATAIVQLRTTTTRTLPVDTARCMGTRTSTRASIVRATNRDTSRATALAADAVAVGVGKS